MRRDNSQGLLICGADAGPFFVAFDPHGASRYFAIDCSERIKNEFTTTTERRRLSGR